MYGFFKKRSVFRTFAAIFMAVIILASAGSAVAWAVPQPGDSGSHDETPYPVGQDYAAGRPDNDLSLYNGAVIYGGWQHTINVHTVNGCVAYCLNPSEFSSPGDYREAKTSDAYFQEFVASKADFPLDAAQTKDVLARLFQFGYTGTVDFNDDAVMAKIIATQMLVWEVVVGERDSEFQHIARAGYNHVTEMIKDSHPLRAQIFSAYGDMVTSMNDYYKLPSFMKGQQTRDVELLPYNAQSGQYEKSFTDTNEVLDKYSISQGNSAVNTAVSGNVLTVSSAVPIKESVELVAERIYEKTDGGLVIWGKGAGTTAGRGQDLVTYDGIEKPVAVKAYMALQPAVGDVKVVKKSEDNKVANITFTLKGNGLTKTAATGTDGVAMFTDLPAGSYTVAETAPVAYVATSTANVAVYHGNQSVVNFNNVLKKFRIRLTKTDAVTGSAPIGGGSLAGAVYGVYKNGNLLDTYTTDSAGKFLTKEYICGDGYTVKEIQAPEGYRLNTQVININASAAGFQNEHNEVAAAASDEPMTGSVSMLKHTDDGQTGIETPEVGAEFQIYLKSAGSYDAADARVKDTMVADANGFASSKALPYGVYRIHQTKAWEGRALIDDFDVFISEDGKVYRFILNNGFYKSPVKLIKVDAETGQPVFRSNAGFHIYKPDGTKLTQTFLYPTPVEIDTFYTNDQGWLITPGELPYGQGYSVVEAVAPEGYVLDPTPVYFDVVESGSTVDNGVQVIEVKKADMAQKGTVSVTKSGETFAGVEKDGVAVTPGGNGSGGGAGAGAGTGAGAVAEEGAIYTPVFKEVPLKGATFEIYAAEDIVTGDGTVRLKAGDLADTVTTDATGQAKSKELYLGKYTVVETAAPEGFVLDTTPREAVLSYAGQDVAVTDVAVGAYDERIKASLKFSKVMEKDERFQLGLYGENGKVEFGLYAAETLTAEDGAVIPADGLIEKMYPAADGTVTMSADLPVGKYYVKELTTHPAYILDGTKYEFEFSVSGAGGGNAGASAGIANAGNADTSAGGAGTSTSAGTVNAGNADASADGVGTAAAAADASGTGYGAAGGANITGVEHIAINNGKPIVNYLKYGSVKGLKHNTGNKPLSSAVFGLFTLKEDIDSKSGTVDEPQASAANGPDRQTGVGTTSDGQQAGNAAQQDSDAATLTGSATQSGNNAASVSQTDAPEKAITKNDLSDLPLLTSASNMAGEFHFDNVPYGTYYVAEIKAPQGYILNDEVLKVEITEDGQVVTLDMVNEPVPDKPTEPTTEPPTETPQPKIVEPTTEPVASPETTVSRNPSTGDTSSLNNWIVLAVSALLVTLPAGVMIFRDRKKR